jgi:nucleoside-diphosphate-sugar epimerase
MGSEIVRQLADGHEVVGIDAAPGRRTTHAADILDLGYRPRHNAANLVHEHARAG